MKKHHYVYLGVAVALTLVFLAIELWEIEVTGPSVGTETMRGNAFGFMIVWWLAIMIDVLVFNRQLRVVEGRPVVQSVRATSPIATVAAVGIVGFFLIPEPPYRFEIDWGLSLMVFAVCFVLLTIYAVILALLPRHPIANMVAGIIWTLTYLTALVFGVGMMMFCC